MRTTHRTKTIKTEPKKLVFDEMKNPSNKLSDEDIEDLIDKHRASRKEKTDGFCPACGKPVIQSDRFCASCGSAL